MLNKLNNSLTQIKAFLRKKCEGSVKILFSGYLLKNEMLRK